MRIVLPAGRLDNIAHRGQRRDLHHGTVDARDNVEIAGEHLIAVRGRVQRLRSRRAACAAHPRWGRPPTCILAGVLLAGHGRSLAPPPAPPHRPTPGLSRGTTGRSERGGRCRRCPPGSTRPRWRRSAAHRHRTWNWMKRRHEPTRSCGPPRRTSWPRASTRRARGLGRWWVLQDAHDDRARHLAAGRNRRLKDRQRALTPAAVELVGREARGYVGVRDPKPEWAMGVPLFVHDMPQGVISPVATRINEGGSRAVPRAHPPRGQWDPAADPASAVRARPADRVVVVEIAG